MIKHCGNCAVYDRKNMKHSELCGMCVTEHFSNGKESDPSMWKPLPHTNADRIRAMSDEELAELIVKHHPMYAWNKKVRKIYFGFDDHRKDNPQRAWLEWLKQPADGGR